MSTADVRRILGEPQQIVAYRGGVQWLYDVREPKHALVVLGEDDTIDAFVEPRNLRL